VGVVDLVRSERSFRNLWLSQVVSELGDWFQIVAVTSIFPTRGGGSAIVAGLIVARHLVAMVWSPFAGVIADRHNRGTVMIVADLVRVCIALGFLLVRGPGDVVLVFALSLILEAFSMLFEPAKGAAIPQVLPASKLYAANALSGATWSAMLALGAMTGGAVASLVGMRMAFVVNAISFAASAVFVARARVPDLVSSERGVAGGASMGAGLAYLRDHPPQRSLLVLKAGALFSGGVFVLVAVFADQLFGDPSSVFGKQGILMGMMLAGRGLGALVMPFAFERVTGSSVRGVARALLLAFPLPIVFFSAFSQAPVVGVAAVALFFAHGGTSMIWVGSSQLLQVTVPNRVLGRVLSVDLALVTLAVAVVNAAIATALRAGVPPRAVALGLAVAFALPYAAWIRAYRRHLPALEHAAAAMASDGGR
jgi:MFS family permease